MTVPDTPFTRGEMYLSAIANGDASGIPETPYTRKEKYLDAIAKGDASGIPDTPYTREEMYLDAIAQGGGGGGGGLEYEEGTYTPSSDVAQPTISFVKSHTSRPFFVLIVDSSGTVPTSDSICVWSINSWYDLMGAGIAISSSQTNYARTLYLYKTSSSVSSSGSNVSSLTGTTYTAMPYYLTESGFTPDAGSTSRYFRSGITYKWFAVWKPET